MDVYQVLRRPVVTEKSTLLQERGKYVFDVTPRANKPQVKEAVERAFDVTVLSVNIVNKHGERRRLANGRWIDRSGSKKAIVTLKPGESIQIFEGA